MSKRNRKPFGLDIVVDKDLVLSNRLTHAERRDLIREPIPMVRYIETKTWAGVLIEQFDPEDVSKRRQRFLVGRQALKDSQVEELVDRSVW